MNTAKSFLNQKARALGITLIEKLGEPDIVLNGRLEWNNKIPRISKLVLLDESIPHSFPMAHTDFVYSTTSIKISPQQACALAHVSGSIIVDQLKGIVTARCGALIKNQVTLGFVDDYVNNKLNGMDIDKLKAEYARRIMADETSNSGKFNPVYNTKTSDIELSGWRRIFGF